MLLLDVNILVYAHRRDTKDHARYKKWLETVINGSKLFGYSELVLSGFLRIVTHPKIFEEPSVLHKAVEFANQICDSDVSVSLQPGKHHWPIFLSCLKDLDALGNDIPDAYHAALALEWDCVWVTTDKGFKRFKDLKSRHPFELE